MNASHSDAPEPGQPRTLDYPWQLVTLTDERTWDAYGRFAGAVRRLAELDPVTDEMVRVQNANVQTCHY